jgi:hypothetical protein
MENYFKGKSMNESSTAQLKWACVTHIKHGGGRILDVCARASLSDVSKRVSMTEVAQ